MDEPKKCINHVVFNVNDLDQARRESTVQLSDASLSTR